MADSLIGENLRQALCQQISEEKYNSNFYMAISAFLLNKGFDGLANHFVGQIDEEHEHSKLIFEFLTDMNAKVEMKQVDEIPFNPDNINSIVEIATLYLDREKVTTQSLTEERDIAIENKDSVAEEFLRQMVDRQRNELKEASTFMDNAVLCDSWRDVKVWSDNIEIGD